GRSAQGDDLMLPMTPVIYGSLASVLLWTGFALILAALIVSIVLLSRRTRAGRAVNVCILLATTMLLVLAGEVAGRIYHRADFGIELLPPIGVFLDQSLGWAGRQ